jgi:F0F1-type ATP synthase assembly protein I
MIKSLLEPDENQPEKIKTELEVEESNKTVIEENFDSYFAGIESPPSEANEEKSENLPAEISETANDRHIFSAILEKRMPAQSPAETTDEGRDSAESSFSQPENPFAETAGEGASDELLAGFLNDEINYEPSTEVVKETANYESSAGAKTEQPKIGNSESLFQTSAEPESFAETARKSGLAYAAAITLFGSIVFMLIIGWFADLLLGSSPWGIVSGIVLGAAIGFFQFFRMTSQIFKK